ncbi:hypothetical protein [uncultured Ruegeria sp.]|uniref:hypothetical protein n=1 Tax=uncultured Ruegeria sp. TaxID=259304 RepID=UPI00263A0584|nr:hypothetical protein [uncultured Ruegeria sp.]
MQNTCKERIPMHVLRGTWARLIILVFGILQFGQASAQDSAVSLLSLQDAKLEFDLTAPEHLSSVDALFDGDPSTIARFDIIDGEPVDVVIGFGGRVVNATELVLSLSPEPSDAPPMRVDVLASSYSPSTGFRSLIEERLDALRPEQVVSLPPAPATWVLIRLFPPTEKIEIAIADLWLKGWDGPPEPRYAFGESPAAAIDMIEGLETLGVDGVSLTDAEKEIFARAETGGLEASDIETIALLASGVMDQQERDTYRQQLDTLEGLIREELDTTAPPMVLGRNLLEWLHENSYLNRYQLSQTDISEVLDQGLFNCVSSAALYNVLGWRLGLDLRAIEVPDHAFSILYDGLDHVDVETTTARGFAPAREQVEEFKNLTGFTYIPESNKALRREIGREGIAALIYYNHGVEFLREGKYQEALLANFRAMSLDPEFSSAVTNALAALNGWSRSLAESADWEQATTVAALGRQLAPDDEILAQNQRAVWSKWAATRSDSDDYVGALEVLDRAASQIPGHDFESDKIAVFLRPAEASVSRGEWEEAFSIADRADALLVGEAKAEIGHWRSDLYLRQARSMIDMTDYEAAASIIAGVFGTSLETERAHRIARYLAQEWALDSGGIEDGLSKIADLKDQLPLVSGFDDVAENFTIRWINSGMDSRQLEMALEQAQKIGPLLTATGSDWDLGAYVYNAYARELIESGDWQAAAELHASGLAAHPDDDYLSKNARYVAQKWQASALAEGGTVELEVTNARLRELFPTFAVDPGFGENEIVRKLNTYLREGNHDGAMEFLDSAQLLLAPETFRELTILIIDHRAQRAMDEREWEAAARIYSNARSDLDDAKLFSRNVAYIAQEWTRTSGADAGAQGVATAAETLGGLFPGDEKVAEMGTRAIQRLISEKVRSGEIDLAKAQLVSARSFLSPEEFNNSTVALYRDWGNARLEQNDWKGALLAYAAGLELVPDSRDLRRNVPYSFQEWSTSALKTEGAAGFIVAVNEMETVFPDPKALAGVLQNVLSSHMESMISADMPNAALELIDEVAVVLDSDTTHEVKVYTYEKWARLYFNHEGWLRAVEIYDQGLADVGNSSLLRNNREYAQSKADEAAVAAPP